MTLPEMKAPENWLGQQPDCATNKSNTTLRSFSVFAKTIGESFGPRSTPIKTERQETCVRCSGRDAGA